MSAPSPFRVYTADELGADGYPPEWHKLGHEYDWLLNEADMVLPGGIKDVVRAFAGRRCIRCHHPYWMGGGEWSQCDHRCSHRGPARLSYIVDGIPVQIDDHRLTIAAGVVVGYGKTVEAQWRILTVHHLDGDKANCRWWNLVALCQRCHLEIQGRVVMDRVWPHEHSPWFRPYVAGYYAWRYLGEEIGRQEAEQRMDELLGLEIRQLALETT